MGDPGGSGEALAAAPAGGALAVPPRDSPTGADGSAPVEATFLPPGLRSLCAIDRYRTVEPSLFRRADVRRYTPTPWPPMTSTGKP
jgi:hypothetical protein